MQKVRVSMCASMGQKPKVPRRSNYIPFGFSEQPRMHSSVKKDWLPIINFPIGAPPPTHVPFHSSAIEYDAYT